MGEPTLADAEEYVRGLNARRARHGALAQFVAEYDRRGAELDRLRVQRDAVLVLHRRQESTPFCEVCCADTSYGDCGGVLWPCPTAAALGVEL